MHAATALVRLGELIAARPEAAPAARDVLQLAGRLASELCMSELAIRAARLIAPPP